MGNDLQEFDRRIAQRLKQLRLAAALSLDELAERSDVSRASLSRLENGEVSPTASVLGRLCPVYGLTMSRLMHLVEEEFAPLVRRAEQSLWTDPENGFRRRLVSPPSEGLNGEVIECELPGDSVITYPQSPRSGLEHHLVMLEGLLDIDVSGNSHRLQAGDCLRYRLDGPSRFAVPAGPAARYLIFLL